jgi:hypothetical protein
MTKFVNIKLPDNHVVDPTLEVLVNKLALAHPGFTFGTKGFTTNQMTRYTNDAPRRYGVAKDYDNPDHLKFVDELNVHCGAEFLGSIGLEAKYKRSDTKLAWTITSWRVDNGRRGTTTSTTKIDVAARKFKTTFLPRNMEEMLSTATVEIKQGFLEACRTLQRSIHKGTFTPSSSKMEKYLFNQINGFAIPPLLKYEVEDLFASEQYKKAHDNYELAEHMDSKEYYPVLAYGPVTYLMRSEHVGVEGSEKSIAVLTEFEQLTDRQQSQIAVLQLMKDNELVNDIGFRFKQDHFYLIKD